MEAWRIYMDELRARGERAATQRVSRSEELMEASHEAYRATSDRLTGEHGWNDERALVLLRGFNSAVRRWLEDGVGDWQSLERDLRRLEDGA